MVLKKNLLKRFPNQKFLNVKLILFAFSLVILIGFASAYTCDIRLASNCNSAPFNNVLMKVSALTNAHGEIDTQLNYQYALCCDFAYPKPVSCSTDSDDAGALNDNRILGLSSSTNAHAEVPNLSPMIYTTDVCYQNLECIHTSNSCPGDYPIEMLSLSSSTNAHIASYDTVGYDINICCKDVTNPAQSNCLYNTCQAGDICQPDPPGFISALDTQYCCEGTCCTPNFGAEVCLNKVCGSYTNTCGQVFVCGQDTQSCNVNYGTCSETGTQSCNLETGQWNTECTGTIDPRPANCVGNQCGSDQCGGTCGTCSPGNSCDADRQCVPDATPCQVNSVSWDRTNAIQGDLVDLNVIGNSDCAGDSVSFVVWEEDLFSADDPVTTNPANANFAFNDSHYIAIGQWMAEWQADADEPPEYYFRTTVASTGKVNESGQGSGTIRLMTVIKGGSPPACSANFCSDYTNQADCESNPCGNDIVNAEALLRYGEVCGGSCPASNEYYDGCACYWSSTTNACDFTSNFLTCPNNCGNGVIDSNEECDGTDLGGFTCEDFDLTGGAGGLSCNVDCTLNTSSCSGTSCNNNGIQETGEECDRDDFSSKPGNMNYTCMDFDDYTGGDLSCTSNCRINRDGCTSPDGGPGANIGNCAYATSSSNDCDSASGLYTATWAGSWNWATTFNSSTECMNAGYVDCYQDNSASGDGKWHYDPTSGAQKTTCKNGKTKTIECPADIALPFFGGAQIILTLLVIAVIYGMMRIDKKSRI